MSELGELLALMHGARARITTVRATVRTWQHLRRSHAAFASLEGTTAYAAGESLAVRRRSAWWQYDPNDGAVSNEADPDTGGGAVGHGYTWLHDPAPAIGLVDFIEIAPGRRAGRPVLHLRAVPRDKDDLALGRLGFVGADELLLDVDRERGSLLRIECRFEGRPFRISEPRRSRSTSGSPRGRSRSRRRRESRSAPRRTSPRSGAA